MEASDDVPSSRSTEPTLGDVINARFSWREVLKGALGVSAVAALASMAPSALTGAVRKALADGHEGRFGFTEIAHGVDETHHVAPGYRADVLICWGDPVLSGAPALDPSAQTAEAQERQFGYNNDYIGFIPLPPGSNNPDHGLLCVNHEYTSEEVMFPGLRERSKDDPFAYMSRELAEIEMAAHGGAGRPTAGFRGLE